MILAKSHSGWPQVGRLAIFMRQLSQVVAGRLAAPRLHVCTATEPVWPRASVPPPVKSAGFSVAQHLARGRCYGAMICQAQCEC
jgi:hypothetical protein